MYIRIIYLRKIVINFYTLRIHKKNIENFRFFCKFAAISKIKIFIENLLIFRNYTIFFVHLQELENEKKQIEYKGTKI